MELGLVYGEVPRQLAEHFEQLIVSRRPVVEQADPEMARRRILAAVSAARV
jgi:hypothetical protein